MRLENIRGPFVRPNVCARSQHVVCGKNKGYASACIYACVRACLVALYHEQPPQRMWVAEPDANPFFANFSYRPENVIE